MMTQISTMELHNKKTVLLSPLDIQIFFMDIPALKEEDREEIIRSRLRTLYPGNSGDTVFDYILCGGKRRGEDKPYYKAIVFAAEKETLALYRERGKFLIPGISILSLGAKKIRDPAKVVILLTPEWAEAARFDNNEIVRYVSGCIGKEQAEDSFISQLYTEAELDTLPVIIIEHPGTYDSGLRRFFKNCIPMHIGETGGNIKRGRIFYRQGNGRRINHRLIIAALIILNGASMALSLKFVSSKMAGELIRLKNIRTEQTAHKKEAEKLEKEIAEIRGRQSADRARQRHTIYEIISEIVSCLANARIQNLTIQEGTFNLEAEGADSIGVFRALGGSPYFYDITLHQAAPLITGGEQFSISGKVNHE
jgi:hypothetical protein